MSSLAISGFIRRICSPQSPTEIDSALFRTRPWTANTDDSFPPSVFTMAKKPTNQSPAPKAPAATTPAKPASGPVSTPPAASVKPIPQSTLSPRSSPQDIIIHVWNKYVQDTPSRTILLDVFMAWLVVIGVLQFLYCVLAGNYVCSMPRRNFMTSTNTPIAIQCIPLRIRRSRRSIRADGLTSNADLRTST